MTTLTLTQLLDRMDEAEQANVELAWRTLRTAVGTATKHGHVRVTPEAAATIRDSLAIIEPDDDDAEWLAAARLGALAFAVVESGHAADWTAQEVMTACTAALRRGRIGGLTVWAAAGKLAHLA